jgi:hypothetical protein
LVGANRNWLATTTRGVMSGETTLTPDERWEIVSRMNQLATFAAERLKRIRAEHLEQAGAYSELGVQPGRVVYGPDPVVPTLERPEDIDARIRARASANSGAGGR